MKRLLDLFLSLLIAPFALAIIVIAAIAILILDRHNPVFAQARLGKDKEPFTLYKLRSMHVGTPTVTTHNLSNTNVTAVGSIIRKFKLDELPQIWNVVVGDMSLVGPRPGLPVDERLTLAREKEGVFSIRPGITGWSQIRHIDMSDPERLARSDRTYMETQSMAGDLKIMLATLLGNGTGDPVSSKE